MFTYWTTNWSKILNTVCIYKDCSKVIAWYWNVIDYFSACMLLFWYILFKNHRFSSAIEKKFWKIKKKTAVDIVFGMIASPKLDNCRCWSSDLWRRWLQPRCCPEKGGQRYYVGVILLSELPNINVKSLMIKSIQPNKASF